MKKRLIGLDGKPLKYMPHPKPAPPVVAPTEQVTVRYGSSVLDAIYGGTIHSFTINSVGTASEAPRRGLRDVVADQLREIHDALPNEWAARAELPDPTPADFERYEIAREWALRHCPHKNVSSTLYARGEYQCRDCGRYLDQNPNSMGFFFR